VDWSQSRIIFISPEFTKYQQHLIVDSKVALVEEELKAYHKNNNNSNEALPMTTYSNSESTILAYTSIFQTLWAQTEIAMQSIVFLVAPYRLHF